MQISLGTRRTQTIALASVLLVLYVNGPIVAHADDGQVAVDQCGSDLSYEVCQPQGDNAQNALVVDNLNNQVLDNQTLYGQFGQSD
jgi:hypothetical protein